MSRLYEARMGLGSTARKIQTLSDRAEELYRKIGEVLERIQGIAETIEDTHDRLDDIDRRLARQEALLEAVAEANDIDPASIEVEVADDADEADEPEE